MSKFKTLDYHHLLKMRKMPVSKMFVCATILRDAFVTMNGSETGNYFTCKAPTIEEWTSQGLRQFDINWLQIDPVWEQNWDMPNDD